MELFKYIIGTLLFGFGAMGIVWLFRNLFRPRFNQAKAFRNTKKWIIIIWNLVFIAGGWYIFSSFGRIPVVGLIFGILVGLSMSR